MQNHPSRHAASNMRAGIVSLLVVIMAFGIGYATGKGIRPYEFGLLLDPDLRVARLQADNAAPAEFDVFWEAWGLVERRFVGDTPDDATLTYGAIEGMLATLDDPYASFAPPGVAAMIREADSGTFEGIGAYVREDEAGGVLIVRPFEDSPASAAGLLPGDVIIAVDGTDIVGLDLEGSLALVRGPAGTQVTLTVRRTSEAQAFDATLTRQRIQTPTVESRMLDDQLGYVVLYEFNSTASRQLSEALDDLLASGADGLILDLRDNPGGFLDEAVGVADLFLPEGDVLIQRDVDGRTRAHHSADGDVAEDIPLVVLVNADSASASEIVAGAIQDLDRGVLVGEQTFGKGSVQLQYDLSDGSILRVTYATWFTPNDTAINGIGILPDLEVIAPEGEELSAGQPGLDTQLDAAIAYLHGQT